MNFYHGTTDLAPITDKILPPNVHYFGTSEVGRNKNLDKVFVTTNRGYASTYARRMANMRGGNPVIYEVTCDAALYQQCEGLDIYVTDVAYLTGNIFCGQVRKSNVKIIK